MNTKTLALLLAIASSAGLHAQTPGNPVVTIQQSPAMAHPLDEVTLSAAVTGAPTGTTFTYQWKLGIQPIAGATAATYKILRCLSRDLGTYECEIVATKGTNTRSLSGFINCQCEYPETVTVTVTPEAVTVIGTAGDDDVEIARLGNQLHITVVAAGKNSSQDYRIDTFTCCGYIPRRVIADLGDGTDSLKVDAAAGYSVVASGEFLGGGQPGDIAIMKDLSGFPNPQVEGFEVVASGGTISGHLAMASGSLPAGSAWNPDNLTPLARAPIIFSLAGGTQSPWTARFVTNDSGSFVGVLPPLPQGMTTADIVATVEGTPLSWSALAGGSVITVPANLGQSSITLGLGVRPDGPCAQLLPGLYPSLLIPFDEPGSDAYGGAICQNLVDSGNSALSGSPAVVPGHVYQGRAFAGGGTGEYQVAGPAGVNPGNGAFSVNCWMLRTPLDDRIYFSNQVILDHTDGAGSTGWKFGDVRGQLYLAMGAGALTTYTSPAAVVPMDGAWHLVSVTVERYYDNRAIFYLDGAVAGGPVTTVGAANLDTVAPLRIGPDFYGRLDELEVYNNRAISAAEVYALWLAGSKGRCIDARPLRPALHFGQSTEYTIAAAAITDPVLIASLRQPLADTDGDGVANSLEYALGSDPMLAADAPRPTFALLPWPAGGGMPRLTLSARRSSARATAVSVTAEFSTDMSQWTPGALLSSEPQTDGTVIETWGDTGTLTPYVSRLGRLKVQAF
ncbi:MAG: LamG domain-containing protein [Verrucomicrobiota bacterium]